MRGFNNESLEGGYTTKPIELGKAKGKGEVYSCRHEPTLIWKYEGVEFYGGSRCKIQTAYLVEDGFDLVINLAGCALSLSIRP